MRMMSILPIRTYGLMGMKKSSYAIRLKISKRNYLLIAKTKSDRNWRLILS